MLKITFALCQAYCIVVACRFILQLADLLCLLVELCRQMVRGGLGIYCAFSVVQEERTDTAQVSLSKLK